MAPSRATPPRVPDVAARLATPATSRVPRAIRAALRRRGITLRQSDGSPDALSFGPWPREHRDRLYQEMQRYSFRLVLRDAIRLGRVGFRPEELSRHASLDAVRDHLASMEALSIVAPSRTGRRYRLVAQAQSLGPTLEWFVAEVLRRELGFCVAWSLPLRGGPTGGDLDVVALAEGQFLFVEVKSGPPKHLNRTHVAAFLDRVQAVAPHGAIFFEDTELRMTDKIVVLFTEELARRGLALRPRRLHRELYSVGPGIFIANAHPDVSTNLGRCVTEIFRGHGVQLGVDLGPRER